MVVFWAGVKLAVSCIVLLTSVGACPDSCSSTLSCDCDFQELGSWPSGASDLASWAQLTSLNLESNGLTALPSQIGLLTDLEFLVLRNNMLQSLPIQIGQLTNLGYWDLTANQLTTLPTQIEELSALSNLQFADNEVTELPTEIGALLSMQFLGFSQNQVTELPVQIGSLTDLESLTLASNHLTALPTQIGLLTKLIDLDTEGNRGDDLGLVVPSQLSSILSLQQLKLGEVECDCELLSWYPSYTAAQPFNVYNAAVCADNSEYVGFYPHLLTYDDEGPCTHVTFTDSSQSETEITLRWTYENTTGMETSPQLYDPEDGLFEIADPFIDCETISFDLANSSLYDEAFGFQIILTLGDVTELTTCIFAPEIVTNNDPDTRTFEHTIENLAAATDYTITVAPFTVHTIQNRLSARYGIRSSEFSVRTADDAPEDGPQALTRERATDTTVTVSWNEPTIPNGEIQQYEAELRENTYSDAEDDFVVSEEVLTSKLTNQTTLTFRSLAPYAHFALRVRARTSAGGFGPWSNYMTFLLCGPGELIDEPGFDSCLPYCPADNNLTVAGIAVGATIGSIAALASLAVAVRKFRASRMPKAASSELAAKSTI